MSLVVLAGLAAVYVWDHRHELGSLQERLRPTAPAKKKVS
jgi:hypothetical protein